jgi:hypothetical protein
LNKIIKANQKKLKVKIDSDNWVQEVLDHITFVCESLGNSGEYLDD